jgi:ABC-type phosphate/phosphonate transport system substrate-binding protein
MKTVFAGSHPTAALAVYNGTTTGGGTNEGNLQRLAKEGQIQVCLWSDGEISQPRTEEEIRSTFEACPDGNIAILGVTDPIPSTPFAIRSELPQSFKDAVKAALLAMKDDAELVKTARYWYQDPSGDLGLEHLDHFFNSLRDIAKLLDLDLKSGPISAARTSPGSIHGTRGTLRGDRLRRPGTPGRDRGRGPGDVGR